MRGTGVPYRIYISILLLTYRPLEDRSLPLWSGRGKIIQVGGGLQKRSKHDGRQEERHHIYAWLGRLTSGLVAARTFAGTPVPVIWRFLQRPWRLSPSMVASSAPLGSTL